MTASMITGSGGYGGRVPSLGSVPAGADHHAAGAAAPDNGASRRLSLRLDPDVEAAGKARDALGQLEGELEDRVLEDMRLLVTELVTNSVRHAEAVPEAHVRLEVSVDADRVLLAVEDGGSGFAPAARTPDSPDDSGWGLHFVERMSSRWGVNANGRTRVWLELARGVS
ncbi:MAG: ATP-binding protein [Thermoleophilaceae bacterium]|nr:ATP-binding protein [Thermoleophilaceae bacterium]